MTAATTTTAAAADAGGNGAGGAASDGPHNSNLGFHTEDRHPDPKHDRLISKKHT